MDRSVLYIVAGIGCLVGGFAKTIPPLIEAGAALVIIGLILKPRAPG